MAFYPTFKIFPTLFLALSLLFLSLCLSFSDEKIVAGHRKIFTCIDKEREALFKFKESIDYGDDGLMKSWVNGNPDCCTWDGVYCSNRTGNVIGLHLRGDQVNYDCLKCLLSSGISPSLGELKHLKYLDLSSNYFSGIAIPSFIGSLINLRHLNLSNSVFSGEIPKQLGNLTRLTSLDLSSDYQEISAKSLNWLSRLTLLKDLNLGGTDLSKASNWSRIIGNLSLLESLEMDYCGLSTPMSSAFQSPNIRFISLSENAFTSSASTFLWLFNAAHPAHLNFSSNYSSLERSLKHLDLSNNSLKGPIPDSIGNLTTLTHLDLSHNSLKGIIPTTTGYLESLTYLNLSRNSLLGTIPYTIGNLKSLTYLDFSANSLSGIIPDSIRNLESLEHMDFSENSLSGPIPSELRVHSYLTLSNNRLQGPIPSAMANMKSITYVDLSNNRLQGPIPSVFVNLISLLYLDLSNNHLEGPIPSAFVNLLQLRYLNLSKNRLEGSIPSEIGDMYPLTHIDLSNNRLQGPIPRDIRKLTLLSYLDLSNNHLEDVIPSTIEELQNLAYLDLSNNSLSGDIPCQLGFLQFPLNFNFSFNNLSGLIPIYLSFVGLDAFKGNPGLRMAEHTMCEKAASIPNEEQVGADNDEGDDKIYPGLFYPGLCVSIGIGLYVGFWGFCGTLTLKNSWRHAYFQFVDHIIDKIYVTVAIHLAKYRRNSQL